MGTHAHNFGLNVYAVECKAFYFEPIAIRSHLTHGSPLASTYAYGSNYNHRNSNQPVGSEQRPSRMIRNAARICSFVAGTSC